ncbi:MAG: adenylate/guanylate cyclase domain-containing protein [Ignavibacteriales bacterium]|nr:MAG: adenylate/guanylate cyclase domain-containing protein [Ignavibacteriales bacterium]
MNIKNILKRKFDEQKQLLESSFARDVLISEKKRVNLLLFIFGILWVILSLLFWLYKEEYIRLFGAYKFFNIISITFGIFFLYELMLRAVISYRIRINKKLPEPVRYGNTFVEISMPTVIMIILSASLDPYLIINGPSPFAYLPFIILSALRLNFKLSVFTGLLAATEYLALCYYIKSNYPVPSEFSVLNSNMLYIVKGIFLLISGLASGFITLQIRRGIFNSMRYIEESNRIKNVLGQQVSQAVVDELLDTKADYANGVERNVCVMFLDIRNFTPTVEKKSPEEIVAYLNTIFGFMIDIINKYNGIINQFVGDGFMATFGAPVSKGNDCQYAVDAAVEIIRMLDEESRKGKIIPTRVGIGIHTGDAVTGNVGSSLRKQYSITGNVVILASRIEQLNKQFNSQLLISKEVLNRIFVNGYKVVSLGAHSVKGREEPVEIFQLV